jgi:hypothetical protein
MPENTTPAPPAETATPQPATGRGYFNKDQLEDITLAETVHSAAEANAATLASRDVDTAFLTRLGALAAEARRRYATAAGEADDLAESTLQASAAATALYTALQAIQSAAKQKNRMLAIDGDPATNFPTDGYLMHTRINQNRAVLLQSAETLIARATEDSLPGYKTPEAIQTVKNLLDAYRQDKAGQQESTRTKELARLDRDSLIDQLNLHRSAVQHAADALWPWSAETSRPTRKTFALPLTRPLNL